MAKLAQELRDALLLAALKGKLTNRNKCDTDVTVTLNKIAEIKQIMISQGKIKKSQKLTDITEAEMPFTIPNEWKWVKLQNVLDVRDGTHDTPKYHTQGVPFITSKNLINGSIDFENVKYISQEDADVINIRSKVEVNDILMAMIGSIGKPVIVKKDREFAVKNVALVKKVPDSKINMEYILLVLQFAENIMKEQSTGGVQKFVSLKYLRNFPTPLPPIEEQQRIVDRVEKLMAKIDEFEIIENELEELKKAFPGEMKEALLQAALSGNLSNRIKTDGSAQSLYKAIQKEKLGLIRKGIIKKRKPLSVITENDIPYPIPDNWLWVRWGELSYSIQYGYNAPAKESGRIKMVRISDIQDNHVVWSSVPYCDIDNDDIDTYLLKQNDILFARTGGTVGKSFLVKEVPEESIYAGYLIRTRYSVLLCPEFLKYYMESQLYWRQLKKGTIATAQPNCNGKTLANMMLPLPPIEEQQRIVNKLDDLLPLCDNLEELNE